MPISPDRHVPTWDGGPSGGDWSAGGSMLGRGLGDSLRGFLGGITNAISGLFEPGSPYAPFAEAFQAERVKAEQKVADQQSKLIEDLDRIQSYGSVSNTEQVNSVYFQQTGFLGWFTRAVNEPTYIPFTGGNASIGPLKNCHVDENGLLVLDAPGLWKLEFQGAVLDKTTSRTSTPRVWHNIALGVHRPGTSMADIKNGKRWFAFMEAQENFELDIFNDASNVWWGFDSPVIRPASVQSGIERRQSVSLHTTVLVPAAGYRVAAWATSCTILPGASTTRLSVSMIDSSHLMGAK